MRVLRSAALLVAVATATSIASAQTFQFQINSGPSFYTWSGTTSLGAMQGNPGNSFNLSGTLDMTLQSGGNPVASGQWLGSNAFVTPDLSAIIPNPVVFLPPLAQIDITGMSFSMSSTPFGVVANGDFSTTSTLTILSGMLTVTPLTGSVTVTDLTGTQGPPTLTTGNISAAGSSLTMTSPMNTQFQFTDPTSGISATLNLNGTLDAGFACPPVTSYCTTSPNTVGPGVLASTSGSTSIAANDLVLTGNGGPSNFFGIFFYGPNQISQPFGEGVRCVGAGGIGVFRLPPVNSGAAGVFTSALDHNNAPGPIAAGETWNFQCWYRDPAGGPAGFNLSDAVAVFFCP